MPSATQITASQLSRLVGIPGTPVVADVRTAADRDKYGDLIPAVQCFDALESARWAPRYSGASVVVVCEDGGTLSEGCAASLRAQGVSAEALEGGYAAWRRETTSAATKLSSFRSAMDSSGPYGSHAHGRRSSAWHARGSSAASLTETPSSFSWRLPKCTTLRNTSPPRPSMSQTASGTIGLACARSM